MEGLLKPGRHQHLLSTRHRRKKHRTPEWYTVGAGEERSAKRRVLGRAAVQ